jgi:hypothetical protein
VGADESTFATVRHRTQVTKGPGSKAAGLAMAFKLIEAARPAGAPSTRHTSSRLSAPAPASNAASSPNARTRHHTRQGGMTSIGVLAAASTVMPDAQALVFEYTAGRFMGSMLRAHLRHLHRPLLGAMGGSWPERAATPRTRRGQFGVWCFGEGGQTDDRRRASVAGVVARPRAHVRLKPYPESRAGRRTVPLPIFAVEALRVHVRDYPPGEDGLVFVTRTGEPLKRGTFRSRVWKPSLTRARLPYALRFHDLRHSYATWLISQGVPINDVVTVMGHEKAATTLNLYAHRPTATDGSGESLLTFR